jgi:ferredoxin
VSRVLVDRSRCLGTGGCEAVAPDVFEVGDDGVVRVLVDQVAADDDEAVRDAVDACPTMALTLDG